MYSILCWLIHKEIARVDLKLFTRRIPTDLEKHQQIEFLGEGICTQTGEICTNGGTGGDLGTWSPCKVILRRKRSRANLNIRSSRSLSENSNILEYAITKLGVQPIVERTSCKAWSAHQNEIKAHLEYGVTRRHLIGNHSCQSCAHAVAREYHSL